MNFHFRGFAYRILIDPLLNSVREEFLKQPSQFDKVIDIACGTGTLALELAQNSVEVTGIDLDEELISYAMKRMKRKEIKNLHFETRDASELSIYRDREFDIAITSMSIHQFDEKLAVQILSEMKRISSCVVIGDYNCPLPENLSGRVAYNIERFAGGDHYRNFKNYILRGGLKYFTDSVGLEIRASTIKSQGTFVVMNCIT